MEKSERNIALLAGGVPLLLFCALILTDLMFFGNFFSVLFIWTLVVVVWFVSQVRWLKGWFDALVWGSVAVVSEVLTRLDSDLATTPLEELLFLVPLLGMAAATGVFLRWARTLGSKPIWVFAAMVGVSTLVEVVLYGFLSAKSNLSPAGEVPYPDPLVSKIVFFLLLGGLIGLMVEARRLFLARSGEKLSKLDLPLDVRSKRFFSYKVIATVLVTFGAGLIVLVRFLISNAIATFGAGFLMSMFVILALIAAVVTVGGFFYVWIPSLIANRALQKGKSWNAFFWLSALVSPLIMWIIAEASSDTRSVYQQPVQPAPVPQQHTGQQTSVSTQAVAGAPAKDTRACPECAEEIKMAAKLCKHCGSKVEPVA